MNHLAEELNNTICKDNANIFKLFSKIGRELYFPRGILFQGAEAKQKAHKFNATIGIATKNGIPMHLQEIYKYFKDLEPQELFNYAPASGKKELRKLWKEKMLIDNPSLKNKRISLPIVTNAMTHGLSICADLFVEEDDIIIIPDKFWGNYKLIFNLRRGGKIIRYPLFKDNKFNIEGLREKIKDYVDKKKIILIFNFPNNPAGYSITKQEGDKIRSILLEAARHTRIIIINDDAYFGLFYEPEILKESLFSYLSNLHENILAIKLDGVTKEEFLWGFRTGFITFGSKNLTKKSYEALEEKVMGIIRGTISNCSMPSQSIIEKMLSSDLYRKEQRENFKILEDRYKKVKEILKNPKYSAVWEPYPFNSGYFMCLKLKAINAETLRKELLNKYGVGIIATSEDEIRIAFSCVEKESLEEIFEDIYTCILDIKQN
ncbi:MAG: aminotransferase class I/II-fold pyridoxal phosphate-dependent enzyme [Promethearchaeota archaeon]|nr:MAG: aminotransferase class I/II-fold pyridoxal phosphate-dependent enzyme [Candidatus Lokiarchaeota archaeon]